ncbi:MAG TPA: DUF3052 family protein [Acidimicrobiales bacterium]|nr:DUF3052 family protein [Acidimicrobiales bacterium]
MPSEAAASAAADAPGPSLVRKLGIRPGDVVALVGAPPGWEVGGLPEGARLRRGSRGSADVVVAFLRRAAELETVLPRAVAHLGPGDALWLAWPRKAAGHASDLGDDVVRRAGLAAGLVDVKVAALGEDWSGLRFVFRRRDRRS